MRSPNSEDRGPKEARKPTAEASAVRTASGQDSEFWTWGGDPVGESLVLQEDGEAAQPPPRDLLERTARFGGTSLIAAAEAQLAPEARVLWREAKELNLIFGAIWRKRQ